MASKKVEPSINRALLKTLQEILSLPTAPFRESILLKGLIKRFRGRKQLHLMRDAAGNLLISYGSRSARAQTICFHAHLDHPGFEYVGLAKNGREVAEGFGGIPEKCRGAKIVFFSAKDGREIAVRRIRRYLVKGKRKFVELMPGKLCSAGDIGMWQLPVLKSTGPWFDGRAFDDNLGVAILVYVIDVASRSGHFPNFQVLFTRAEEPGYVGALEAMRLGEFSLARTIITLEMPRASKVLKAGDGVMLRAGDRNMDFEPFTGLKLAQIARSLAKKKPWFRYQRALGLLGGTECTVFQLNGFSVGALCLPVVNAHNRHDKSGRPVPERIHKRDLLSMISLLFATLHSKWTVADARKKLTKKLTTDVRHLRKKLYR